MQFAGGSVDGSCTDNIEQFDRCKARGYCKKQAMGTIDWFRLNLVYFTCFIHELYKLDKQFIALVLQDKKHRPERLLKSAPLSNRKDTWKEQTKHRSRSSKQ